jgi:hypothetical protein
LSSTTAVVAVNLTLLFTPDDRGYDKFNRSAISFMLNFDFSKIRDDSLHTKLNLFSSPVFNSRGIIPVDLKPESFFQKPKPCCSAF